MQSLWLPNRKVYAGLKKSTPVQLVVLATNKNKLGICDSYLLSLNLKLSLTDPPTHRGNCQEMLSHLKSISSDEIYLSGVSHFNLCHTVFCLNKGNIHHLKHGYLENRHQPSHFEFCILDAVFLYLVHAHVVTLQQFFKS